MKILSITAQKPDSTGSGVYLTELVKGFKKLGHEQAVIAGVYEEDIFCASENIDVYPVFFRTDELPFPIAGMSDEMPYQSTKYSDMTEVMTEQFKKGFSKQIQNAIIEFNPDIILCHHLYYLTSLVRELCSDKKVFGICHGSDLRQIKKNPWQRNYIIEQIKRLDGIFALHSEQRDQIIEYYGCTPEQVSVIGTGYNSDVFYISDSWKSEKKTEKLRLIFAGKLSEKKGVMSLIRSLSNIVNAENNIELALAGGYGNEKEYQEICELAEECPAEVQFLGKLSHEELAKELNQSDIFVLPSFYEGLPLVIIEAMACGLKAVCTDLPGIQRWLDENLPEHGVVFVQPPKMRNEDEPLPDSLPEFEYQVASAIEKARVQHLPNQEYVQKLSWNGLCRKLMEIINK